MNPLNMLIGAMGNKNPNINIVKAIMSGGNPKQVLMQYINDVSPQTQNLFDDNIESFKQAISFFKKYYPEHNFKAIYGYSWLFSPQIKNIIDNPNSNISKMIDTGYIVPCTGGDSLAFEFIYWDSKMTVEKMPTNTSMLRNIKK